MSSNEWLPAQVPFDLVRRGFAPDQVTAHLERLEYDLRIATANGDATNQRLSEVTANFHSAQSEVDQLRTQLDNLAREPVSMTGLSNRMQRMIRLAEEEAAEIRARANAEAEKLKNAAAALTAATAAERETFDAERERTRRQLADQVRDLLAEASAEAEATRSASLQQSQATLAAATAESERLITEATLESRATLTAAREESTATLTAARAEATATLTSARAEAEHTLTSARDEAEALTAASAAERLRLDTEGNERRNAVDEDFEIAISARRADAHQRLTEREEISVADAKQRVADATAEAEHRVQEATEQAAELVRRAAAESHHRVTDADEAVQELTSLRSHVLDQLASLRDHLGQVDKLAASAPSLLDPPDSENGRPVSADFPIAPQERPTGLPAGYDSEPGPWDKVTVESVRAERAQEQQQTSGGAGGESTPVDSSSDAIDALAADFSSRERSARVVSPDSDEFETDTFARVVEPAPVDAGALGEGSAVPGQQRGGFRAFAERAIGGR